MTSNHWSFRTIVQTCIQQLQNLVCVSTRDWDWPYFTCIRWQVSMWSFCWHCLSRSIALSFRSRAFWFLVSSIIHITYYAFQPLPTIDSFPIYVLSNDTTIAADACSPLPSITPDLSKYVTIIRLGRGTCAFVSLLIILIIRLMYDAIPDTGSEIGKCGS